MIRRPTFALFQIHIASASTAEGADGKGATVLTLKRPLSFPHVGVTEKYGDELLHMYSEVGLLSRAITIRSRHSKPAMIHTPASVGSYSLGGVDPLTWPYGMLCNDGEPRAHEDRFADEKLLFDADCLVVDDATFAPLVPENQTIMTWDATVDPLGLGNQGQGQTYGRGPVRGPPTGVLTVTRRGVFAGFLDELRYENNGRQFEGATGVVSLSSVSLIDAMFRGSQDAKVTKLHSLSVVAYKNADDSTADLHPIKEGMFLRGASIDLTFGNSGEMFTLAHSVILGPGSKSWSAIWSTGSLNYTANLVIGGGSIWPCFHADGAHSMQHNVAAGCISSGYLNVPKTHANNTAHNNQIGLESSAMVPLLKDFLLWRSMEFAIWTIVSTILWTLLTLLSR